MEYISKLCSRLVAKSCPTLCNLMGCSLPGSSVHGISQARILEWVVISICWWNTPGKNTGVGNHTLLQPDLLPGSSWPRDQTQVSYIAHRFFICHEGSPVLHIISYQFILYNSVFPSGASGKEATCQCRKQETWVQSLSQEDPLEKSMATHSSILASEIPWTESLVGYSPWGHKQSDTT